VVQGEGYVHTAISNSLPTPSFNCSILTHCHRHAVKDKSNHAVVLDKGTHEKLQKDVQSYRLITVAVLVDRLKINGSLARAALKDLEEKGVIKKVVAHSRGNIYSEYYHSVDSDDGVVHLG
jgi:small subunit ribosomal protein S25e